MKSNVIAMSFTGSRENEGHRMMQKYLDGENNWKRPIMEEDIVDIHYSVSRGGIGSYDAYSILLIHREPLEIK